MQNFKMSFLALFTSLLTTAATAATEYVSFTLNTGELVSDTFIAFIYQSPESTGAGSVFNMPHHSCGSASKGFSIKHTGKSISITQANASYDGKGYSSYLIDSSCKNMDTSKPKGNNVFIRLDIDPDNKVISCGNT